MTSAREGLQAKPWAKILLCRLIARVAGRRYDAEHFSPSVGGLSDAQASSHRGYREGADRAPPPPHRNPTSWRPSTRASYRGRALHFHGALERAPLREASANGRFPSKRTREIVLQSRMDWPRPRSTRGSPDIKPTTFSCARRAPLREDSDLALNYDHNVKRLTEQAPRGSLTTCRRGRWS